jgi:hypothetical protein
VYIGARGRQEAKVGIRGEEGRQEDGQPQAGRAPARTLGTLIEGGGFEAMTHRLPQGPIPQPKKCPAPSREPLARWKDAGACVQLEPLRLVACSRMDRLRGERRE